MTISHVQDAAGSAAASASTCTVTVSTTAGNTLIVSVEASNNTTTPFTISSITDTAGNTWQFTSAASSASGRPPNGGSGGGGNFAFCAIGYCINAAAVTSVTVTTSLAPHWDLNVGVSEFSGVPLNWGIDVAVSGNTFASGTTQSTPSVTPSGFPELAIVAEASDNPAGSISGGFTAVTGFNDQAGWQVTSSAGALSATFTTASGTPNNYGTAVLVLGPPLAPTVSPPGFALPWPPALARSFGPGQPFTARGVSIDPAPQVSAPAGVAAVAAATAGAPVQPVGSPAGGPWVLSFHDEFDNPVGGKPDPAVWADRFINGDTERYNFGNATETQWYPHSQAGSSVSGGILTLTGRFESPTSSASVGYDPACPATLNHGQTPSFTSGWYQSHPGFQASYGYWEVRAKLPDDGTVTNAWPAAMWLVTCDGVWPPEFDLEEWFSANGHGGYFNESGTKVLNVTYTGDAAWHVWGLRWSTTDVTLFKDGVSWGTYTAAAPTALPQHMQLQLAAQFATGTGFPCTVQIVYVRHWTVQGVPAQPSPPTSLSPSTGIPTAGTVAVSFNTVAGATSYRVTACPVDGLADSASFSAHTVYTGTSSPITATGLTNGARYSFTVAAINATGYSIESLSTPQVMGGVLATPGVAAVGASALGAAGSASLSVNAGLPQVTAAGLAAAAAEGATAGLPDVLAAGPGASTADTATAGLGTVLGAAPAPSAAEGATAGAGAVLAAALAASAAETATPGAGVIDAAALAATVSTSGGTSAPAGLAQILTAAPVPAAAIQVTAGLGTVLAVAPGATGGNVINAPAGTAAVTSLALAPGLTLTSNATAGLASLLITASPVPAQHVVAEATAAVTDPRDGTRTVTDPDTSAPGVT